MKKTFDNEFTPFLVNMKIYIGSYNPYVIIQS